MIYWEVYQSYQRQCHGGGVEDGPMSIRPVPPVCTSSTAKDGIMSTHKSINYFKRKCTMAQNLDLLIKSILSKSTESWRSWEHRISANTWVRGWYPKPNTPVVIFLSKLMCVLSFLNFCLNFTNPQKFREIILSWHGIDRRPMALILGETSLLLPLP